MLSRKRGRLHEEKGIKSFLKWAILNNGIDAGVQNDKTKEKRFLLKRGDGEKTRQFVVLKSRSTAIDAKKNCIECERICRSGFAHQCNDQRLRFEKKTKTHVVPGGATLNTRAGIQSGALFRPVHLPSSFKKTTRPSTQQRIHRPIDQILIARL